MMYCKCDNCKKEAPAYFSGNNWHKPWDWFQRLTPEGDILHACSIQCVDSINEARKQNGKDSKPILPI